MQVLLAYALEFLHDLLGRGGGGQGDDDDGDAGHEEGGQQLVDAPGAAHGGQQVLPDEDHRAAGDHAGDGALLRGPLPEQGEEDQRAEGCAEAGPGEGHDAEDGAAGVPGQQDTHDGNADDGAAGGQHGVLGAELLAEEVL